MKKLRHIGKLIVIVGIFALFTKVRTVNGFGGIIDNSWEVLAISLALVVLGFTLIQLGRKTKPRTTS